MEQTAALLWVTLGMLNDGLPVDADMVLEHCRKNLDPDVLGRGILAYEELDDFKTWRRSMRE